MRLNDYQRDALRTAQPAVSTDPHLAVLAGYALGVVGEAGEVADHVKKALLQGHPLDVAHVVKELGDVLWYVAAIADLLGNGLEAVAQQNLEKLRRRYPAGFTTERSLNREDR